MMKGLTEPIKFAVIISLAFFVCALDYPQKKSHPDSCPAGCGICQDAIKKGLEFLAKKQNSSGGWCWDCKKRLKKLRYFRNADDDVHAHVIFTSLAMLAFLAEGSTPEKGKYRDNLQRALDFLLRTPCRGGRIEHGLTGFFTPLQTGFALLVFSEIYPKIMDDKLRDRIRKKAQKAIRYLTRTMRGGAWGYSEQLHDHVGTSYGILTSLAAARNAGFMVRQRVFRRAIRYLQARIRSSGKVDYSRSKSYQDDELFPRKSYRPGGVLFALHLAGAKGTKKFKKVKKFFSSIKLKKILKRRWKGIGDFHPLLVHKHLYGFFFATLGARVIGGEVWKRWFIQARDYLLKKQSKEGEWRKVYRAIPLGLGIKKDKLVSRSLSTSIALIVLQLPLGRLSFVKG
jgi:hypothetical protein